MGIYSWHHYDYSRIFGVRAGESLAAFSETYPTLDLDMNEKFHVPLPELGQENIDAIMATHKDEDGTPVSEAQARAILQNKFASSTVNQCARPAVEAHIDLVRLTPAWAQVMHRNLSTRYKTYSRRDDGPREYQMGKKARADVAKLQRSIAVMVGAMDYTAAIAPVLDAKINHFINVGLGEIEGDAKELAKDILDIAYNIHDKNFSGEDSVRPMGLALVGLLGALGGLVGGAGGVGLGIGAENLMARRRRGSGHHFDY